MASMNGMVWIALGGGVLLYLVYSSQAGAPAPAPVASAAAAPPQTVSPSCTNFAPCTCPSGYSMVTSGPGPSGAPVTVPTCVLNSAGMSGLGGMFQLRGPGGWAA